MEAAAYPEILNSEEPAKIEEERKVYETGAERECPEMKFINRVK